MAGQKNLISVKAARNLASFFTSGPLEGNGIVSDKAEKMRILKSKAADADGQFFVATEDSGKKARNPVSFIIDANKAARKTASEQEKAKKTVSFFR